MPGPGTPAPPPADTRDFLVKLVRNDRGTGNRRFVKLVPTGINKLVAPGVSYRRQELDGGEWFLKVSGPVSALDEYGNLPNVTRLLTVDQAALDARVPRKVRYNADTDTVAWTGARRDRRQPKPPPPKGR